MRGARAPILGFAYNIGVKNSKKVMEIDKALLTSRTILLKRDKMKPKPSVKKIIGSIKNGKKSIFTLG